MKKFHTFKHQSFELLTGLRSFFAVTLMLVMALGNIKAEEITVVFQDYGYSDGQEVTGGTIGTQGYFSFTTAQNNGSVAVKYYDNGTSLRMYADRNGGNGCSFTVNVLNSNYVITGMQIISQGTSYTPPVAYSVNGGAEVAATPSGAIYTISDVYATQSLMFKNVQTGSTTQLRPTSIVITYKQICKTPTDFVVSNIGNSNADLSWTKGGAETNWQMNLNGTISDLTGCTTNVDTVSYGLSGLNINQEYHIAVRSACDVDNFSLWTDTIDFTTTCPEYITNLPDLTICSNESYDFFGTAITAEGNYTHTLQSTTGCDSIINLHVLVNQVPVAVLPSESICEGSFFNFGGENLTLAGTYRDTLIGAAATGCDSIVEITLIVNPKAVKNITATICDGDSYFFDGNALTAAGDYTETLAGAAANGCDSVTNLTLFVQPIPVNNINVTICDNESYEFGGEMLTIAGNYADTILHNGCDSIVNLTLTVNPTYATADAVAICADELPYTYGDTVFQAGTVSDVYVIHSSSELGCDSVITLTLNVKQLYIQLP
ncbi:MAG: fibronectin type III domain-containing protein [Bacteroidales bacterium]|nr:fibronectin type III domain-containing protein [Bacteroidales bacterium]